MLDIIHTDTIGTGLPIVYFKGSQAEFSKLRCMSVPKGRFNLSMMKCSIMLHFIWVFTICQSTSSIQRVDLFVCFRLCKSQSFNTFSVMSGRVFIGRTSTKQDLMCLAQGHTAVTPVRLEPVTPRSRVKHSSTDPLRSITNG